MANLPTLAQEVDTAIAMAGFSGAADGSGETQQIAPDFEAEEEALAAQAAAMGIDVGSDDLADWVTEPMTLDGITVADDKGHLPALVHALNLPDFVKKGLGSTARRSSCPTAPSSSATPRFQSSVTWPQLLDSTAELRDFVRTTGELTLADRRLIVGRGTAHPPGELRPSAVEARDARSRSVQRLRLLQRRLADLPDEALPPEVDFHAEVTSIFASLRDLHTGYRLPAPFASRVAWLRPRRGVRERGRTRYL